MTTPILKIAVSSPLRHTLDYLIPEDCDLNKLIPGIRIKVPFRSSNTVGILTEVLSHSTYPVEKLRRALEILDDIPVYNQPILELLAWATHYYHYAPGEVFLNALPALLRQGRATEIKTIIKPEYAVAEKPLLLNSAQQEVLVDIRTHLNQFYTFLLHGVTGSGKTEIYLQAIDSVINAGKQALILVPEIGLTPQTLERFQRRFPFPIAVLHSGLTDRERLDAWLMAKNQLAPIVIGTRSAIFTPLANLGIIILDEEHDISFKQQDGFRYSARDLAIIRGKIEKCPVILGSATPSLETYFNAQQNRYHLLQLPERAGVSVQPTFKVVDIRNQKLEEGLSQQIINSMQQHLEKSGQILLFLNRRGYAPALICHSCGWAAKCLRCDAHLTLHYEPYELQCHHCASLYKVETDCPACKQKNLLPIGLGTEKLEQVLLKHFPEIPIARVDRDTTRRKGSMQKILDRVHTGQAKILIGTQMLSKGHHFNDVTLVIILNIDGGLYSADFRATERMAQNLLQVAGRAGRVEKPGEVVIQTHNPDHPLLQQLIKKGYKTFANLALEERNKAKFPPYSYLALFRAEAIKKEQPLDFLDEVKKIALQLPIKNVHILGPISAPMEKRAGRYRTQLLLQSTQRGPLHTLIKTLLPQIEMRPLAKKVRWSLDIDPQELF